MSRFSLFIGFLLCACLAARSQQKWDRPMELRTCSIAINADQFIATTFIEMEFCNPNEKEIEGLYRFELRPGQVITAFQLELNGKYRDGSIEEKWKATNAYNSIVGKRIDPALLTMEYADHYSLRIYPVPGNGCRKVTMTIQQALFPVKQDLSYVLPLNVGNEVKEFNLTARIKTKSIPVTKAGLISEHSFINAGDLKSLNWSAKNISLRAPVSFSFPVSNHLELCTKKVNDEMQFAMRFQSSTSRTYVVNPNTLTVYWDASASGAKRDINREINFLKQFVTLHRISQLRIIPFNTALLDTAVFYTGNNFNSRWHHYLQDITYDGATQLGVIDLKGNTADVVLLFSDGNNTYGKKKPLRSGKLVFCIYTSNTADVSMLRDIVGQGGGKLLDLNRMNLVAAVNATKKGHNWLMNVTSSGGKMVIEQLMPMVHEEFVFINGVTNPRTDTVYFHYGNENQVTHIEKFVIRPGDCVESSIDRLTMLNNFDQNIRSFSWSNLVDFGIKEKVVTPNTAFIVLERVEDYVKYNITPPKELEAECAKMNWVKRDTRWERSKIDEASEYAILHDVVDAYNDRIRNWHPATKTIYLDKKEFENKLHNTGSSDVIKQPSIDNVLAGKVAGIAIEPGTLEEVVVTGYSQERRKHVTGSITQIDRTDIFSGSMSVEQALQGKVAGLHITGSGRPADNNVVLSIRGSASFPGNNQPLYIVDGVPVFGNINDVVSTADIDYISVFKGLSAGALYGSRAANGAIIIHTKRGKNTSRSYVNKPYRLKDMEDVEYLQELKAAPASAKLELYEQLKEQYSEEPGFYMDAAQHLFESGIKQQAFNILMNAAEAANGSSEMLVAIAYVLESWGEFAESAAIYTQLIEDNPMNLISYHDLAWSYYQQGKYQQAIKILYSAIKLNTGGPERNNLAFKAMLLNDMNTIIGLHRDKLDTNFIPASVIQPLASDIRLVISSNKNYLGYITVKDPDGKIDNRRDAFYSRPGAISNTTYEYQQRDAKTGKYKIAVSYYDYRSSWKIPSVIRIRRFMNFGQPGQHIAIENIIMDNQRGEIEIAELRW
jgi:TonB-dependent SusC/RagA subfamily outer membrane receptor